MKLTAHPRVLVAGTSLGVLGLVGVGVANAAPGHGPGHGGPSGAAADVIHSQSVRALSGGTYETDDAQKGTVTAVSATSLTVTSADDYAMTYVLDDSTKIHQGHTTETSSDLATGDSVSVRAVVSNGVATATDVSERPAASSSASPTASASATS